MTVVPIRSRGATLRESPPTRGETTDKWLDLWPRPDAFQWAIVIAALGSAAVVVWSRELRSASWLSSSDFSGYAGFYRAQASSMLRGTFAVPDSALGDECYQIASACVGYFGVTPSILRLPAVLVGIQGDLTPLFVAAGYLFAAVMSLSLLVLLWHMFVPPSDARTVNARLVFASLAVLAGPGSLTLMSAEKDVADEAILWGVGFTVAVLAAVTVYIRKERHVWLWLAAAAACLAVSSRPSLVFSTIAVGAVVAAWQLGHRKHAPALIGSFALMCLPPLILVSTYLMKFGTVFPDQNMNRYIATSPFWRALLDANGGRFFGLDFIPTHIWDFFRPDALHYKLDYPRGIFFTQSSVVWPVSPEQIYREPSASLTTLIPVTILLMVTLLVALVVSTRVREVSRLRLLSAVGLASGVGLLATWGHVAMTNRYLVDAWPMALMLSIIGGCVLASRSIIKGPWNGLMTVLVVTLTLVGLITVLVVMR